MPAHYNYFPPPGSVTDLDDARNVWVGTAWIANGVPAIVPSGHRLVGKPDGSLSGWYYDWQRRAWIEPGDDTPGPRPEVAMTMPWRPGGQPATRTISTHLAHP